jgi:Arc/MetJ-type ribon-helix-helix transcriptional regulator
MHIILHPDIEKFIDEQLRRGDYRSPDEVVTEALYLLWQRDQADDPSHSGGTPDAPADHRDDQPLRLSIR